MATATPANRKPNKTQPTKMAKAGEPLATMRAKPRTTGGRLTYAGADLYEQREYRRLWERAGQ